MAYADANTNRRKLTAGVAVAAMEIGLGWAIIAGLAMNAQARKRDHVIAVPIEQPSAKPPPPPPDHKNVVEPPKAPPPIPTQPVTPLNDTTDYIFPEPDTGKIIDGTGIKDVNFPKPDPTPLPSPKPHFAPKAAFPRTSPGTWLSTDDYPIRALNQRHEGRTGYRLTLDERGNVTGCTVTSSSGWDELDQAACKLLPRRAKLNPARGEDGAASSGTYEGFIAWRLPPEE